MDTLETLTLSNTAALSALAVRANLKNALGVLCAGLVFCCQGRLDQSRLV